MPSLCFASGPDETEELCLDVLRGAIDDAVRLGYRAVAVSGGEPLTYRPLPDLALHARARGMGIAAVMNGMLTDKRRLDPLRARLTLMVVNLDGSPDLHNRMRDHPRAFDVMRRRLRHLRESGIPFGFLFTLCHDSIGDLDWAAEFAVGEGARFLQIHPLNGMGRAADDADVLGTALDGAGAQAGVRAAARLEAAYADRLRVTIDYQPTLRIARDSAAFVRSCAALADAVTTLVVEADGTVVPVSHGFARNCALRSLHDARIIDLARLGRVGSRGAVQRSLRRCLRGRGAACRDNPIRRVGRRRRAPGARRVIL